MKLDIKAASEMYALALERSKAMGSSGPRVPTSAAVSVAPDPWPAGIPYSDDTHVLCDNCEQRVQRLQDELGLGERVSEHAALVVLRAVVDAWHMTNVHEALRALAKAIESARALVEP